MAEGVAIQTLTSIHNIHCAMDIIHIPIKNIRLNPDNPRVIQDAAFKRLVRSVQEAPWMLELRPLVVDSTLTVIGGNMRLKAALTAGLKTVPILRAETLTPEQREEFIIKDNLPYGEWAWEELRDNWDVEQLAEWGLELSPLTIEPAEATEDDFEVPPEAGIQTDIVLGDIIDIGPHRLMCGDSTRSDHVEMLLGESKPVLMVTDPPYGVEYDANWRNEALSGGKKTGRATGKVTNDEEMDWSEAYSLSPSTIAYVYHAAKHAANVFEGLEKNNFIIRNQIIWAKNQHVISRGDYHFQHEPCWYAVKKGATAQWLGDRKQTTLWQIDKPAKSETGHSTQKPVECMARPIKNHNGDVYDPFIGSGTTMVAAHQLGRICYGMEISPKYCQIIINRMLKLDPTLRVSNNGNTME